MFYFGVVCAAVSFVAVGIVGIVRSAESGMNLAMNGTCGIVTNVGEWRGLAFVCVGGDHGLIF